MLGFFPLWIVGIVDYHGCRPVALQRIRRPNAADVVTVVDAAFTEHGQPERILSDRGAAFQSEFSELLKRRGVKHSMTKPYHPWTNGRIERLFRTFKSTVRELYWLVRSRRQWNVICRDFVLFYNEHRPSSANHGRTPLEIERGEPSAVRVVPEPVTFFEGRLEWWRLT